MTHPWLIGFQSAPDEALDRLLSGTAFLPGLERAAPSNALKNIFAQADTTTRDQLDVALTEWLKKRRQMTLEQRRAYGLYRFITEYSEGLATIWHLELTTSAYWLRDNLLDLMNWAKPLRISPVWNLPHHVAHAGAWVQAPNDALRFFWLRLCNEAVDPDKETLLDAALNGLARQQGNDKQKQQKMLHGLARWASDLSGDEGKGRFLLQWRSIKARFPNPPQYWRDRWADILPRSQTAIAPYRQWLIESERGLDKRLEQGAGATVQLPDINVTIKNFVQRAKQGVTRSLMKEMLQLLSKVEQYADQTGYFDFLVKSACQLGLTIVHVAPGHALEWARKALCWSPNDAFVWDLRGRALYQLERVDLAEWVYWEAVRRIPDNAILRVQLSRLLRERKALDEAVQLLEVGVKLNPKHAHSRIELARLLAHLGQRTQAIEWLRQHPDDLDAVGVYILGQMLIAEARFPEAREVVGEYRRRFGQDFYTITLSRLLATGADGQKDAMDHFLKDQENFQFESRGQVDDSLREMETDLQKVGVAHEMEMTASLQSVSVVAQADMQFRLGGEVRQQEAKKMIHDRLQQADDDQFAWVVGALNWDEWRQQLRDRAPELPDALAVQLAVVDQETNWDALGERFSSEQYLIDLIRIVLVKNEDQSARARLLQWLEHHPEKEDPYQAFLKVQARPFLHPAQGVACNHALLKNVVLDAIKQCVDVNNVIDLAA